jgi:4-aminobutyrate aminotransferase-like enzyme
MQANSSAEPGGIIHQTSMQMSTLTKDEKLTAQQITELSKKHTISEWAVQDAVDPLPIDRAEGIYLYTPDGKRYIDFNSQLMSVNIGHSDKRVVKAIQEQAEKLCYVMPGGMTTEPRARLGAKLAELCPGDIDVFFFTNGGAEAVENAFKIARAYTGRYKIMSRYRSYHGATAAAMAATANRAAGDRHRCRDGSLHRLVSRLSIASRIRRTSLFAPSRSRSCSRVRRRLPRSLSNR